MPPQLIANEQALERLAAFGRNAQYAKPGPYVTQLSPSDLVKYLLWKKANIPAGNGPYEGVDAVYDMPRYWKEVASQGQNRTGINPADQKLHYPDTYKTPYEPGFSHESVYATPDNPLKWFGETLLNTKTGDAVSGQPPNTISKYGGKRGRMAYDALLDLLQATK